MKNEEKKSLSKTMSNDNKKPSKNNLTKSTFDKTPLNKAEKGDKISNYIKF